MRDTDDLRRALAAETVHLTVHIPTDRIRRRARGIRVRRSATVAVAGGLAVLAVAAPIVLLRGGGVAAPDNAGQLPSPSPCPTASAPDAGGPEALGPLHDTGGRLDAAGGVRYDVLIGLAGTREQPDLTINFRDRNTGVVEAWTIMGLLRGPDGDLRGKTAEDATYQFVSTQLTLGPRRVLDLGLYTRTAHRIAVASEGQASEAETALNATTGWTLFWVERSAAPLPPDYNLTADVYDGPEVPILTAYDANGRTQHTVTGGPHVGISVQNPRDHGPVDDETSSPSPSPSPPPPCASVGPGSPTDRQKVR